MAHRSPIAVLVVSSLVLLLAAIGLMACETQTADQAATQTSEATATSQDSSTSTSLPVSIPTEFSRFAHLVKRLQDQGVAVAQLRQMPSFADDYGAGVEVVLRSKSSGQGSAPEDVIGYALVLRAAILEKMAGVSIEGVGVAYLKPSGEIVEVGAGPIDKTIGTGWYGTPGLGLEEVARLVRASISTRLASGPFQIVQVRATEDEDGTRVVWAKFTVASVAIANDAPEEPGNAVADAVDVLNTQHEAKIGVFRTEIDTTAGEPVLWVLTDLELQSGTAWSAPGITNLAGPRPTTTVGPGGNE